MRKCPQCNTWLMQDSETCPLCHCVTEEPEKDEEVRIRSRFGAGAPYPNAQRRQRILRFWLRLILFIFIVSEAVLAVVNYYVTPGVWWCLISGAAFIYTYVFLFYWVYHDSGFAAKVGLQLVFTMLILFLIDLDTGYHGWALKWAIPGVILFGDGIVFFLMMLNRSRWWSYTLLLLLMGICSVAIISIEVASRSDNILLPIICVIVSVLYLIGTILIGERAVIRELRRRFHV